MSPITPLDRLPSLGFLHEFPAAAAPAHTDAAVLAEDQVELSDVSQILSRHALPRVRSERVADVRAAIHRGDYDSPEKLEFVLDALVRDFEHGR